MKLAYVAKAYAYAGTYLVTQTKFIRGFMHTAAATPCHLSQTLEPFTKAHPRLVLSLTEVARQQEAITYTSILLCHLSKADSRLWDKEPQTPLNPPS